MKDRHRLQVRYDSVTQSCWLKCLSDRYFFYPRVLTHNAVHW